MRLAANAAPLVRASSTDLRCTDVILVQGEGAYGAAPVGSGRS